MNIKYVTTYSHRSPAPTSHFLLAWIKHSDLCDLTINIFMQR